MNRLGRERSPYLLQHAHNPVDWFPWGDEAFARARAEDKPIFLSIGYSTCHWCHVMEHESFENAEVAHALNERFVSIKVDREERPDVDRVYMSFVQGTTGSGGWPMSVWLTPDLKPFYGGTYFPPTSRWGRPGFIDVLREIARVWSAEREKVTESAETLTKHLQSVEQPAPAWTVPNAEALARTVQQFKEAFDPRHGGFGDAPKFPRPMAHGGMRDHVGGGFHRYSVDAAWRVPHFEKMLYDQAQLVLAFVEAAQVAGDPFYAEVAEDTVLYVLREMTDAAGGFHSAEDADSVPPEEAGAPSPHKKEGAFYLWRADELDALLGDDSTMVKLRFGVRSDGNAPQDPQQEFTGKNLLYVARSVEDIAAQTGNAPADIVEALNRARVRMFEARLGRPRPHRDDKVLTAWNGLMIGACARLARVLSGRDARARTAAEPYLEAARRAAGFIRERMWNAASRTLLRRYRDDHAEIEAYAEDYAYLIFGLIELFQADGEPMWLEWALALQRRQDELFWDEAAGGWFSTTGQDPSVLVRMKEDYDGAEPTASAVSVMNLLLLSHLVEEPQWTERIERTLRLFGRRLEQVGRAVPMMAAALSTYVAGVQQIVIVEGSGGHDAIGDDLARAVASTYQPFAIVLRVAPGRQRALAGSLPFIAAMEPVDGHAAVYVCRNFTCRQPATTVEALQQELRPSA